MKFREYLEKLNKLAEQRPELLEMEVIYSRDDEGNGFQEVWNPPSVGYYENSEFQEEQKPNAVCIN